jgi:HSP20 family protein
MSIVQRNPGRNLVARPSAIERYFDDPWPSLTEDIPSDERALVVDIQEDDHAYTVITELPGVEIKNVHVYLEGDYLVIEGKIPEAKVEKAKSKRTLVDECSYGMLSRVIYLPEPVDSSKTKATYKNGVLTLTLPKTSAGMARVIPIKMGRPPRA